jgi:hypothetical protein
MKKIEMIRCFVRSPRPSGDSPSDERSPRYVPSEIFRLWRYLMESVKGFEISDIVAGVWLDEEMFTKERDSYGVVRPDVVMEVFFNYTRDTSVGRPVIRYFPQDRFEAIVAIFLRNFSGEHIQGGTRQTRGRFIALG